MEEWVESPLAAHSWVFLSVTFFLGRGSDPLVVARRKCSLPFPREKSILFVPRPIYVLVYTIIRPGMCVSLGPLRKGVVPD